MNRCKSARCRIAKQNRNTISSLNSGQHPFCITNDDVAEDRIAALILRRLRFRRCLDHANIGAVNLPATSERPVSRKKLEKAATILQNVLCRVVIEARETKRIGGHFADAAEPC